MSNPWFRAYTEMVDDAKLRLLAFEDRWHFVALLCCKGAGLLDEQDDPLLRRKVAVKLGLALRELDEVARRLAEVGLIDLDTLQPLAWEDRQFKSDNSTERVRAYRERMKREGNVSETTQEAETETDNSKSKGKSRRASAPPVSKPDGVSDRTWADWLALRKAKRAPVTETVVAEAAREAAKAGMPLERFLAVWCARGSQGLQADWLKPSERAGPAPGKQAQGLMALEGLKRGRMDSGRDCDGVAEALPALPGPHTRR